MNRRQFRSLRSWALTGVAAAAIASPAWAQEARRFDIPQQSLVAALEAFGKQGEAEILFSRTEAEGHATAGVSGNYEPAQALAMLLDGSGLKFRQVNGNTYVVEGAAPQSGSAAGDGADNGTVQALIVTAQKREEDIQDVPIAISAFTQEDLTRSQVAGGPDLVTQVPNFTFTKTNFSSYSIQIRGIGTQAISATTDPAVAVAFNNTPFIRNRFFEQEFYDLERVEVLRGPQGTLYGRNATAGVVNIISAKPKFRYEAKLSADLGNYSSSRVEGMVNIPLVEDKVALRVAGAWTKRDGYVTNELSGSQTDGRDLWSTRVSLRVQPTDRLNMNLIWEHFQEDDDRLRSGKQLCHKDVVTHIGDIPITRYFDTSIAGGQGGAIWAGVQAGLSQGCTRQSLYDQSSFQRPNGLMLPYYVPSGAIGLPIALTDPYANVVGCSYTGGCDPRLVANTLDQPQDLRVIQSTVDPKYRAQNDLGELQVSYDLTDTLTLTSETAYSADKVWSLEDYNRFNTAHGAWLQPYGGMRPGLLTAGPYGGVFCDPQLGCSDRLVAVDLSTAKSTQFSQEFRLASSYDGPFNFSLGANFLRSDSEDKYYVFFNSTTLVAAAAIFQAVPPWVAGQSDNGECLRNGYLPGDPNGVYAVQDCTYIDPNPIESLNDKGHNYFLSKNPYKLISYAMFGEAYYQIVDNLKLTAGVRWTVDKKEAPRIPSWILASQSVGYPVAEAIRQEWREPTGRLALDWKPNLSFTDQTLIYGSYAHGYKAGGANPPGYVREFYADAATALANTAESATRPRTFQPEFVNAFELGTKNTLDEGRVTANLAAFYYDYTGYQVSEIVDRSAFNRNFDATVWGAELEAEWRPLENLKLGFKGGYEKTRIADGQQAIDLMDRTAGHTDWLVARPFPTYASSCVLPVYVFANPDGTIGRVGGVGGGGPSGCELAYSMGLDPVTTGPYVDLANGGVPNPQTIFNNLDSHPGYPGFDPSVDYGNNGGEGFFKQLGGNELPNAPHFTATVTGDYTVPLPNDWLMTLHSDVHWQSQSWWRVFNDSTYDKLHPYFTMNLAAIFTNEDAGWNIMAYIKNVTNETAITGAFLNSDDTGLTTNVFLTEPRLYGLRVTKNWSGGPWWTGANPNHPAGEPYPFTVELGGQVQRQDAPAQPVIPGFTSAFPDNINVFGETQNQDLDWGDGREVRLTYAPANSPWTVSAGARFGRTNGKNESLAAKDTPDVCAFAAYICTKYPQYAKYSHGTNFSTATATNREEHHIVDFEVGRDAGFGDGFQSRLQAGLRYADLKSSSDLWMSGISGWFIPDAWLFGVAHNTHYKAETTVRREFKGLGPTLSWEAAKRLWGDDASGRLDVDWSVTAGVLFGKQKAGINGTETVSYYQGQVGGPVRVGDPQVTGVTEARSKSATTPLADLSLGLSYEIQRIKVGAGYRWERYFNAIDGGYQERKSYDRTIDGPYFKIAVGFGG